MISSCSIIVISSRGIFFYLDIWMFNSESSTDLLSLYQVWDKIIHSVTCYMEPRKLLHSITDWPWHMTLDPEIIWNPPPLHLLCNWNGTHYLIFTAFLHSTTDCNLDLKPFVPVFPPFITETSLILISEIVLFDNIWYSEPVLWLCTYKLLIYWIFHVRR